MGSKQQTDLHSIRWKVLRANDRLRKRSRADGRGLQHLNLAFVHHRLERVKATRHTCMLVNGYRSVDASGWPVVAAVALSVGTVEGTACFPMAVEV
jgi:hypothetical protein